jgi:hypothetical protein
VAKPFSIALPPDHILTGSYTVRLTALAPTTGAVVSGVNVQNVTIQVEDLGDTGGAGLASGPFMFVPGPGA